LIPGKAPAEQIQKAFITLLDSLFQAAQHYGEERYCFLQIPFTRCIIMRMATAGN